MTACFPPRRIACLTEETVETLYLLGEQERIVGVSGYAVRPPEVRRDKPRVSAFTSADVPKILALEPDLVLTFSDLQAGIVADLIRAGLAVHAFNQRSIAGILAMIRTCGALVGVSDKAEALVRSYERRLADVAARAQALAWRPRVYFEEWDEPLISGIGWVSELIEIAGGRDIFADKARAGGMRQDRQLRGGDRRCAGSHPGLLVRQEGCARPHSAAPRVGSYSCRAQRSDRRNQIAAHPPAWAGGSLGWS